jgi:signal transduction histidine kinase
LTPSLIIWIKGPVSAAYYVMLLPVVLASLLTQKHDLVAFLSIASTVFATIFLTDVAVIWTAVGVPAAMCVIFAIAGFITTYTNRELLYWAKDSQMKDARRADIYYEQREQLKDAMSELRRVNGQLEYLNKELDVAQTIAKNASNAKSIFMSNMSHELRTPLNVVIGYTDSMLNMPKMYDGVKLPDIYKDDIQLIKDNGEYLVTLINDILDLSKIEAGKLELHCAPVELTDLFKGVIATSIGLVKDKPVQLRPDFPDDLPEVWADSTRVRQIILNLMSNAIKFTASGSVTLSARQVGDNIKIAVTDTGIGIPEEALKTIFDRFKQAERDTDKRYGGTGLGLDISQQLADMHGSVLTVDSIVGQGSVFSFTLPLAAENQKRGVSVSTMEEIGVSAAVFADKPQFDVDLQTILIVEDNSSLRKHLHQSLEDAGYIVIATHDGAEAISLATGLLPSIIVLDVPSGEVNNRNIIDALQADLETAGIPIIVGSTVGENQRIMPGTVRYVETPITPEKVIYGIQSLMDSRSLS